ncbi:T9SS type A sorting domain-containing protein [candidate division KSB1 bacterium]|nr:T9SS type A sorting domain-containing protein [candidate division KSB1 bacterium]
MHANGALTIEKGDPSTYNYNLTATGKITIQKDNIINGNVKSPLPITNQGTVNGTITVAAVANEPLPSDSYTAGGPHMTVPSGGSLTLAPGSYGIVTLNNGGTLKLTSGEYRMNELRYPNSAENGVLEINLAGGDPIAIKVVDKLQFGQESVVRLLPNGEDDSELVTFFTLQSSSVTLGRETYLLGNFNAPNAKVTLAKNSQLRGAICAEELLVERDCLFLHHDSPGSLPGPGNLPKAIAGEVEEISDQSSVLSDYALEQNYPNPFNPTTKINFQLPVRSEVRLFIYNIHGQLVRTLVNGEYESGKYEVVWDGKNEAGAQVATGLYVYVFRAGEFVMQRKLILMR